ncbi:MAG: hypothetical protein P4M09_01580 [Devosia sp.]|nr:hypothetical protein [Devosia sp.]
MPDDTTDMPRPAATSDDKQYSLTIEAVAQRYAGASFPRTIRTLQRYCASGHLDCLKSPTQTGDMYLVTPQSVARHLAELEQISAATAAATGRDAPRQDAATVAHELPPFAVEEPAATATGLSRQAAAEDALSSRFVELLESENQFLREQVVVKDSQIKELTERSRETNHLVAGLQRMLSPLLGTRDPFPEPKTETPTSPIDREGNLPAM